MATNFGGIGGKLEAREKAFVGGLAVPGEMTNGVSVLSGATADEVEVVELVPATSAGLAKAVARGNHDELELYTVSAADEGGSKPTKESGDEDIGGIVVEADIAPRVPSEGGKPVGDRAALHK